jgi:hypothetical protein
MDKKEKGKQAFGPAQPQDKGPVLCRLADPARLRCHLKLAIEY